MNILWNHPWTLLGLAVLVLPLLAPKFLRQKPVQHRWGSLMILQRAVQKAKISQRKHDILILVLRMSLLAFLIFGLAEPVLRFSKSATKKSGEPIRIVIVDGTPESAETVSRNFAFFFKSAIESVNDEPDKPRFEVEIVPINSWPDNMVSKNLFPNEILILCEPASFTAKQAEFLDGFLRSGNGVMIFCGKRTDVENWNHSIFEPLFPNAFLEDVRSADAQNDSLDPHEYRHEIVKKFQSHPESGLLQRTSGFFVPLNFSATENDKMQWTPVLSFSDGYPFLAAYSDKSRCLLFYSTSLLENGWVAHPTFVPLMLESVFWLQNQTNAIRTANNTFYHPLANLCFFVAFICFCLGWKLES